MAANAYGRQAVNPSTVAEGAFLPRNLDFEALVKVLVEEHGVMKSFLTEARDASAKGDYGGVTAALRELDPVFRQHIADEEAQVLKLLIGYLGVEGAREEIEVFQQHRPIYQLMQLVGELASKSPGELPREHAKLEALFDEHTALEERRVFPLAVEIHAATRT